MLAEAYLPNRVDRLGEGPLGLRLDVMRLDSATVGLLSFGTETRLRTTEATNWAKPMPKEALMAWLACRQPPAAHVDG